MKKIALILMLLLPFLADAQGVRIWQLSSKDKTNATRPAGETAFTDGTGSFVFGNIDTSKVAGLAQYIIDHTITSATDSVKLSGTILQIFSGGSSTPTTVNLTTLVENAGKIDSLKFEANYLKVYQNGASVPDSVLILTPDDQTAAEVTVADIGNHYDGTNVEDVLKEIGEDIATAGDNWGSQVVQTGPGLIGNGTSASPLAAAITSVNGQTGTVTINVGVTSVNGQTGTVTITAPVTSVNGQTGTVTITSPVTSVNGQTGTVTIATGGGVTSVNGQTGTVTVVENATHTGDVTGATALTIANNIIDYNRVAASLKGAATDNDGAWDFAANGIVTATISSAITVSFTNLQVNKSLKIKLIVSTGGSITWPSGCVVLKGSETIAAGSTYYIFLDCWASDLVLVSITKTA